MEKKGLVLQVDQQTSIDFDIVGCGLVVVGDAAPLLDTESTGLGTDLEVECNV